MLLNFHFNYNKQHLRQCLLALAVAIDCMIGGAELSFSATLLPQLEETNSTIKFTENEETYFASALALFCLPGTIIGCFVLDWFGRKWTYAFVAFLNVMTWTIITFATQAWHLFLARILQGLTIGISFPVCMCFVSEVSSVKHRSAFINILNIGVAIGQLMVDALGSYYPWRLSAVVLVGLSIIDCALFLYLNNTHVWYLARKDFEGAKQAYFWYNTTNAENTTDYNQQVEQVDIHNATTRKDYWKACRQREFIIPLLLMCWFYITSGFSGGYAIALYSVQVMRNVVSFDEYLTTIFIDIIRILAAILTAVCVKHLRIRVIINSCVVLCVASLITLCIALFWQDQWSPFRWIVLGAILFYTVVYNIGIINMSNVCMGELFTGVTKPLGTCLSVIFLFGMNFIIALIIPMMFRDLGNVGTFLFFAVCIIVGGVGLFIWLPETRNVTNDQIRNHFKKQKS